MRDLPATRPWADCCDVVGDAQAFVATSLERARNGLPLAQLNARGRLEDESWSEKALRFETLGLAEPMKKAC